MDELIIREVKVNKRNFMHLLLIGDESEAMVNRYIDEGVLFVGFLNDIPIAVCLIIHYDADCIEIKNLAVEWIYQRKGYGSAMLDHIHSLFVGKKVILGTGETKSTLCFYESCGYVYSHRICNYFTDNYPDPIIEDGIMLKDMIYLKKQL